jgi:putative Mg2+ transporter-C (MgtC) family protein
MWGDGLYLSALLSLVIAAALGGVIGFERAGTNHDAGLRTHVLVCLGAAAVMVLSRYLERDYGSPDIMRLGAQVISGIGFLGVGCIIVTGDRIKGLTTAAGLWSTACVGLVVGMGYYLVAITVVALMLIAILGLRPVALRFHGRGGGVSASVTVSDRTVIGNIFAYLNDSAVEIASVKLEEYGADCTVRLLIEGRSKTPVDKDALTAKLYALEHVKDVNLS